MTKVLSPGVLKGLKEVRSVGDLFNEIVGEQAQAPQAIQQVALEIIGLQDGLTLSMKQWHTVQTMIETGIQAGILRGLVLAPEKGTQHG